MVPSVIALEVVVVLLELGWTLVVLVTVVVLVVLVTVVVVVDLVVVVVVLVLLGLVVLLVLVDSIRIIDRNARRAFCPLFGTTCQSSYKSSSNTCSVVVVGSRVVEVVVVVVVLEVVLVVLVVIGFIPFCLFFFLDTTDALAPLFPGSLVVVVMSSLGSIVVRARFATCIEDTSTAWSFL